MSIRILVTGGTFDKEYNMLTGKLVFEETHVPEMLDLGRCVLPIAVQKVMMIDSLEMTDAHRAELVRECNAAPEDRLLITHGTDTMAETAQYLAAASIDKTIVLTGAMIPYKFGSSDGFFNLGAAIAFLQTLPKGVYVAMNGRFYDWDNVRKNKATGFFEEMK